MNADPATGLVQVLRSATFGTFRGTIRTQLLASRPWASNESIGTRLAFLICFQGFKANKAATAFAAGLSEREFDLPGHFVADIAGDLGDVRNDRACLTLEALTVEED